MKPESAKVLQFYDPGKHYPCLLYTSGTVVEFERDALLAMGQWLRYYGEAIYSATANPFDHAPEWGDITRKGDVYKRQSITCMFMVTRIKVWIQHLFS